MTPPAGHNGLYSLTGRAATIVGRVDAEVEQWAATMSATPERHSELLTPDQLRRLDYFDSFPHLAHRVTPWLPEHSSNGGDEPELVLTSAACYGAFFARIGSTVDNLDLRTLRQTCRRRERDYEPWRRQREFQMREVVALGTQRSVDSFLERSVTFVEALAARFGVSGEFLTATDPFFRRDDPRRTHQRLFPTKQEFTDSSGLAVASVNSHRNFFGERCDISLDDGTPASTGCVAFGLERWVDAVLRATGDAPRQGEHV